MSGRIDECEAEVERLREAIRSYVGEREKYLPDRRRVDHAYKALCSIVALSEGQA